MGKALDRLIDLLDLEQIEVNIFRGRSPEERVQRVFGGQVAGQALVAAGRTVPAGRPVHSLHAYFIRPGDPALRTTRNLIWLRVDGDLPDDPLLHVCLMTYASDMSLLDSVLLGHGLSWLDGRTSGASLDHAMWFHRPFRADRWLLYAQESPVASGARGLATGQVFTTEGELVVSVVQEGLIRATPPR